MGKLLVLDKATLSGVQDRMEEGGWIRKETAPDDKRALRLYSSEKADGMKKELIELRKKSNETLLAKFSDQEQILLKRFLIDLM